MAASTRRSPALTVQLVNPKPIKVTIAALGGQGGGVLTGWLADVAHASAYTVQTTSVPGVAQRTGATLYYLEFFAGNESAHGWRRPVLALMPTPGDVNCVLAAELLEAARAVQRGLVTSNRTILIASTHRVYTISERSALGDGAMDSVPLLEMLRANAERTVLFDMAEMAERDKAVISAVMLGALAGAGVLPFAREAYEDAIRRGGLAVKTNLTAFSHAFERSCQTTVPAVAPISALAPAPAPALALAPASVSFVAPPTGPGPADAVLRTLIRRARGLPLADQTLVLEGVRRLVDYQDVAYARLYLDRLYRFVEPGNDDSHAQQALPLLSSIVTSLALWMSFEDTIRVADLKIRSARFTRIRAEVHADTRDILYISDFLKPRVAEIAATLPVGVGRWVRDSPAANRWLQRFTAGRRIRANSLFGFLCFAALAGLRRWRRATLRFHEENARIEHWLEVVDRARSINPTLAVEIAKAQRLVKGYGETNERGWHKFCLLMNQVESLSSRADGAAIFRALQVAALADEDGIALRSALETYAAAA